MLSKSIVAATAGLAVALPVGPALAKDNRPEVRTSGQCTGTAVWKLKVKQDDAGVEVEFEVDSDVAGQTWDYTLNGPSGVLASGTKTTAGTSGSFDVEVSSAGAVTDTFTGLASFNGQTCDTTVSSPAPTPSPSPSDDDDSDDGPGHDAGDDRGGKGSDDTPGTEDSSGSDDSIDGTCTDDSVAMLRVKGKKATLHVDSSTRGQQWRYEIRRDGKVVKKGTARTKGSKAKFKVKARSKAAGAFTASATRVDSDDTCEIGS